MAELFQSIVQQVTNRSLSGLLSRERQRDIRTIGKSWDFYNGDQELYTKKYRGETLEDYNDKDKPTFNYTKLIIDEYVAGVFAKPVQVLFDNPAINKRWEEIVAPYSYSKQLPFMKKVQRIAEISETAVVMIRYDQHHKRPYFEDIRGEYVSFMPREDNPREVGALIISYVFDTGLPDPQRRFMERIEIWNDEKWEIWIHSPTTRDMKKIAGDVNPYGMIPMAVFRPEEDDNGFYGIGSCKDVVVINETYNNLWTALVRITVFQSFSVLVVMSDNEIQIEVAPTRYLKLPNTETAEVKYITPDAKIEQVRKVLDALKADLQDFSRVPQSVFSSEGSRGAPQSGYALKIKRIPIEEVWDSRRNSYGPAYSEMIVKTLVVDAVHRGELHPNEMRALKPDIMFSNTIPGLAPQEQLIQDQFDLRHNIITPVDLYMRVHPEVNRNEAIAALMKNAKENEKLGVTGFDPQDPEGDSAALRNVLRLESGKSGKSEPFKAEETQDSNEEE